MYLKLYYLYIYDVRNFTRMCYSFRLIGSLSLILISNIILSQQYSDYIGLGHNAGIEISSSHNTPNNSDNEVLTGANLFTDLNGASRFLRQATMGSNYEAISSASQNGLTNWLDNQLSLTPISFSSEYQRIYDEADAIIPDVPGDPLDPRNEFFAYAFYEMGFKLPDVLRQKVAFALSQIFVISPTNSTLSNRGFINASYYDILYLGAFDNFRDMLYDVSMHPAMGLYLSHFKNRKADIIQGSFPDENYAREIMQLFTIGLYELNADGSFKLDSNGETIPTYTNEDIQELSKIWTGLSGGVSANGGPPIFTAGIGAFDLTQPMKMYQIYHDQTEKVLIDGTVIPANQSGMDDINQAIDALFNHENVGPFISTRLIQQLVKSNPSPQYIKRMSSIFNNNGSGERGDLEALIRGILLDPEARDCEWIDNPTSGKLTQPVEKLTHLFTAFDLQTPSNKYWFRDEIELFDKLQQSFLAAPTVFNFYTPFFAEKDFVATNNLVSPEFQILNSTSGIHYLNVIEDILKKRPFINRTKLSNGMKGLSYNSQDEAFFDYTDETNLYDPNDNSTIDLLLDRLDIILCSGQLTPENKVIIKNTIIQNRNDDSSYNTRDVLNDAIYYIMISPDYNILK